MDFSPFEIEKISIPNSWKRLQKIKEKWGGVFMVVGGVSSGKSTFVKFLASSFLKANKKVAIIDADIGQSWIGPPTTISAIILPKKEEINFMRPDLMEFFGAFSPSFDIARYLRAFKNIIDKIKKEKPFATIVDTTGLIDGAEGLNLKLKKAEILSPTMITLFKKNGEIDHIIKALIEKKFNLYILKSPEEAVERSMNKRREYREKAFKKYFEGSKVIRIKNFKEDFEVNTLVGILNHKGETLALGIVIGKEKDELLLYTPLEDLKEPFSIKKSSVKLSLEGKETP